MTDHNGDLAFDDLQAHRSTALTAFLAAGTGEPFSRAAAVTALGTALRAAALHRDRGIPIDGWLAGQIRLRGMRENAAIVAVMRCMTQRRAEVADAYRRRHPDRTRLLDELLAVLDDRID